MFGRKKPEVLVIGAGPVGLFAALTLARRGVPVQIVDEEWRPTGQSYALALHARSLRLLEEAGLHERILEAGYPVHTIGLYDRAGQRAALRLDSLPGDSQKLAVLPQSHLEEVLERALEEHGVHVQWSHHVAILEPHERGAHVTIERLEQESLGYSVAHTEWVVARTRGMEVPYVIGADGHRSDVRRALEIDFPEVGPTQFFAVFEFHTDADLGHEMRIVLDDDTSGVLWPLPGGYCRFSFELPNYAVSDATRTKDRAEIELGGIRFPMLSEEHLHDFIDRRAPWFTGAISDLRWRLVVRFERRLAARFGRGRMWLAGDAAHMTGPVGVQSMNVGLAEAADLAHAVAGLVAGEASPHRLEDYDAEHQAEWQRLLGLKGAVRVEAHADPWVAKNAARLLPALPASGDDLSAMLRALGLALA